MSSGCTNHYTICGRLNKHTTPQPAKAIHQGETNVNTITYNIPTLLTVSPIQSISNTNTEYRQPTHTTPVVDSSKRECTLPCAQVAPIHRGCLELRSGETTARSTRSSSGSRLREICAERYRAAASSVRRSHISPAPTGHVRSLGESIPPSSLQAQRTRDQRRIYLQKLFN